MSEYKFVPVNQLLPPEILNSFSSEAKRLFERVWNLMAKKKQPVIWFSDRAASIAARIDFEKLAGAKEELTQAGLFKIIEGKWPAEDPPNICHRYRWAAVEEMQESITNKD